MYGATLYNVYWSVYLAGFSHCSIKSSRQLKLSLSTTSYCEQYEIFGVMGLVVSYLGRLIIVVCTCQYTLIGASYCLQLTSNLAEKSKL
jgi:hypothetical protein